MTKFHKLGGLCKQQTFSEFWRWGSPGHGTGWFGVWWGSASSVTTIFSPQPHLINARDLSGLLLRALIPFMKVLPSWTKVKVVGSCPTLCNPMDYTVRGILQARSGMGSLSLLQGIFPTQGSNPGLLHCRQILYQLGHQGRRRILEWVAYSFSIGSFQPRNWTGVVSCIAGRN